MHAVELCERVVVGAVDIPSSHVVGVGMTHMVYILSAIFIDGISEDYAIPACRVFLVNLDEVIVFRYTYGSIVEIVGAADDTFKVGAAIVAVAEMFTAQYDIVELAENRVGLIL